jgi:5-methylcytosine-specific restriction endonuclease McrA
MSRLDYPFYVNGVDERVRWDSFAHSILSDLCTCAMWQHWDNYDHNVHDYDDYCNVSAWDMEFMSCAYCGDYGVFMNLEHILPRKHYPDLAFDPENIVLACACCNKEKGNKVGKSVGEKILPFQKRLAEKSDIRNGAVLRF